MTIVNKTYAIRVALLSTLVKRSEIFTNGSNICLQDLAFIKQQKTYKFVPVWFCLSVVFLYLLQKWNCSRYDEPIITLLGPNQAYVSATATSSFCEAFKIPAYAMMT